MLEKVIFILAAGRSGSTLLDKVLGGHPKCLSMGEISNLPDEIVANALCGCGTRIRECPFWRDVCRAIDSELGINPMVHPERFKMRFDASGGGTLRHRLNLLAMLVTGRPYGTGLFQHEVKYTRAVYSNAAEAAGASVVIDSTKSLSRALVLAHAMNDVEVQYIHLVRDGRAVLYSHLKPNYVIHWPTGEATVHASRERSSPTKVVAGWKKYNERVLFLQKTGRLDAVRVHHEELCTDPSTTVKDLCRALSIEFHPNMLVLDHLDRHIVGGNSSRVNAKRIKKAETAWKQGLDREHLNHFQRIAGKLNKALGYE